MLGSGYRYPARCARSAAGDTADTRFTVPVRDVWLDDGISRSGRADSATRSRGHQGPRFD